jgi:hypothetical protein
VHAWRGQVAMMCSPHHPREAQHQGCWKHHIADCNIYENFFIGRQTPVSATCTWILRLHSTTSGSRLFAGTFERLCHYVAAMLACPLKLRPIIKNPMWYRTEKHMKDETCREYAEH